MKNKTVVTERELNQAAHSAMMSIALIDGFCRCQAKKVILRIFRRYGALSILHISRKDYPKVLKDLKKLKKMLTIRGSEL